MIHDAQFTSLLTRAYDAAADPTGWPDFVTAMGDVFRSRCSGMFIHDFSDGSSPQTTADRWLTVMQGLPDSALQSYQAHYSRVNPWLRDPRMLPIGKPVTSDGLYAPALLKKSEFYADWLRPLDLQHSMGVMIDVRTNRGLSMTFLRPEPLGPFRRDELAIWQRFIPHLQRAVELHQRLATAESRVSELEETLSLLPTGALTLDERGRVKTISDSARRLLQGGNGLHLGRDGRLAAATAAQTALLESEIRAVMRPLETLATGGRSGPGTLRFRGTSGSLHVRITGLPRRLRADAANEAVVAVFLASADVRPNDLAASLRQRLRLTPAEARLACALALGQSLSEYAEAQRLSINTVRTQLRSATLRVGVRRQAELVRTVLTEVLLPDRALPGMAGQGGGKRGRD
ncbi:MAG: helix-turn-helix transcriptional regulator [Lautropia sp.]